ncbi:MAG: CBS domain-containing protein [Deltaproteobacteria bacterium]|nr:CBS domain-containing protein [Deltaproteobacteria bacterium]
MLQAREIMTREVITVSPEASVEDLARLLETHRISGVPVVEENGRLVGVVTQSDLIQRSRDLELPPALNILDLHLFLETPSHFKRRLEKMLGDTVRQVMTPNPLTIPPDMPVKDIAVLMDRRKVHTLPVLEGGKLVGIVGKMDLIRALARQPAE